MSKGYILSGLLVHRWGWCRSLRGLRNCTLSCLLSCLLGKWRRLRYRTLLNLLVCLRRRWRRLRRRTLLSFLVCLRHRWRRLRCCTLLDCPSSHYCVWRLPRHCLHYPEHFDLILFCFSYSKELFDLRHDSPAPRSCSCPGPMGWLCARSPLTGGAVDVRLNPWTSCPFSAHVSKAPRTRWETTYGDKLALLLRSKCYSLLSCKLRIKALQGQIHTICLFVDQRWYRGRSKHEFFGHRLLLNSYVDSTLMVLTWIRRLVCWRT